MNQRAKKPGLWPSYPSSAWSAWKWTAFAIVSVTPTPVGSVAPRSRVPSRGVENDSPGWRRSEEHTSELQSLMRISYAVFCLNKNTQHNTQTKQHESHQQTIRHN